METKSLSKFLRESARGLDSPPPAEAHEVYRKHGFGGRPSRAIVAGLLLTFVLQCATSSVAASWAQPSPSTSDKLATAKQNAGTVKIALSPETKAKIKAFKAALPGVEFAAVAPTGSMKPTFDENYIVALQTIKFEEIKGRDVVLRESPRSSSAIMHRVQPLKDANWRTQGDGNPEEDLSDLTSKNFLGRRAVAAIRLTDGHVVYLNPETWWNSLGSSQSVNSNRATSANKVETASGKQALPSSEAINNSTQKSADIIKDDKPAQDIQHASNVLDPFRRDISKAASSHIPLGVLIS